MSTRPRRILVLGPPRSATTWVAEVLALVQGVRYVHEPDNEKTSLLGLYLKRHVPRFPFLRRGDSSADYELLWRAAFHGAFGPALARAPWLGILPGTRATESVVARKERHGAAALSVRAMPPSPAAAVVRGLATVRAGPGGDAIRVVKSVHGVLASEWIAQVAAANRVVIVRRNPCAVVASLRRMRMPDAFRPTCLVPEVQEAAFGRVVETEAAASNGASSPNGGSVGHPSLRAMVLQLAAIQRLLAAAVARNPAWTVVLHEELCRDPVAGFHGLYERVGLPWTEDVREGIERRNRPGQGYSTARVASAQIGKWRKELSAEEATLVSGTFEALGVSLTEGAA